ncbi:sigma 54-interacting transcriptional regulator [Alteribacillus sp. HJP-4]|uniref:sigma 54-interacting transcriptional regulator n=1 Tax=Alteribacillus sp. HJP-4 TaxID=2775394 RepID=UPI0035CD2872
MYRALKEAAHPIHSLSLQPLDDQVEKTIQTCNVTHLFLKKDNAFYAYVSIEEVRNKRLQEEDIVPLLENHAVPLSETITITPERKLSIPFLFQILGKQLVLIKGEAEEYAGYLTREELLIELFQHSNTTSDFLKMMLSSIPRGIFVVDDMKKVVHFNDTALSMMRTTEEKVKQHSVDDFFHADIIEHVLQTGETVLNQILVQEEAGLLLDYSPIFDEENQINGVIIIVQDLPQVEEMALEIGYVKDLNRDLNAILATMYDEILVVDQHGTLLRHSENYLEHAWSEDLHAIVGQRIHDYSTMEQADPSLIDLVLEEKKKITSMQTLASGQKVLSVGNPIFGEDGIVDRIVIASRDITETTRLKSELRETRQMTDQYKEELQSLKKQHHQSLSPEIVYGSKKMESVMATVEKLADFHSTVLILGESGVGKELIAKAIHDNGARADKPFVTVNCGAIPEDLLESELFGYVKGAFTGADSRGKVGYFEQANHGVLFLDEIGELSLHLQVKLLRVLQEREVSPIGSVQSKPIDVQIVTATNQSLEKLVKEGTFREDLYYRINVIPIRVPALRERPEDIPLLSYTFMDQLNRKYDKSFHLTPEALQVLEAYGWPGNIRELQNVIERLVVTADAELIEGEYVRRFLHPAESSSSSVAVTEIMPLKEAKKLLERQMVELAMERYKTTTAAAEKLGMSQSAVSRKYNEVKKYAKNHNN